MNAQSPPNRSRVVAHVVRSTPDPSGWGAWAELDVHEVQPDAAFPAALGEAGTLERVFVPPPLMDVVQVGKPFEGSVTFRAGQFALVPAETSGE